MPRPVRMSRRVCVHVPADAEDMLAQVSESRERRTGFPPVAADLWREAMVRGLRLMLAEEPAARARKGRR